MSIKVPIKEYLKFNSDNLTEGDNLIYQNAERALYYYRDLFIDPPRSLLPPIYEWIQSNLFVNEVGYQKETLKSGGSIEFDDEQLVSIAKNGFINVPSCIFRGKTYRWKTRSCFMKGFENIKQQFWKDIAQAVYLVKVTLRDRICAEDYSIKSSLINIYKSIYQLIDILIGLPHTNSGNIERKLEEEMLQYLSCELRVSSETKEEVAKYWDYFEHLSCLPKQCTPDNIDLPALVSSINNKHPPGFFVFMSPEQRQVIDLRLTNAFVEEHCRLLIRQVLNRQNQGSKNTNSHEEIRVKYEKCVEEMIDTQVSPDQIRKTILKQITCECNEEIFENLRQICHKHNIPDSIYEMLIANFKFSVACDEAVDEFDSILDNFQLDLRDKLADNFPMLCLVPSWNQRQISKSVQQFLENNRVTPYHLLLEKCRSENLFVHEYFLNRIIKFIRIREKVLREQLQKNFSFPDKIYRIELDLMIPELWTISAITIGINKVRYELNRVKSLECRSSCVFWRWWLFACHLVQLIVSFSQIYLIIVPFRSRLSFPALFRSEMSDTKYSVNQETGQMMSYQGDKVPTLASRISDIKCRINQHSGQCSVALISSYARLVLTSILHPVINITISCLSILIGLLIPVWVPIWIIILVVYSCFVFDSNSIGEVSRYLPLPTIIFGKFALSGIVNLCIQILCVLLIPLISMVMLLMASLRVIVRYSWDFLMFHLVLKKVARTIPISGQCNWFYCLHGDGDAANAAREPAHVILQPEQVIILYLYELELLELELWHRTMETIARAPLNNYERFMSSRYGNLGLHLNYEFPHIKTMLADQQHWLDSINNKYSSAHIRVNVSEALTKLRSENNIKFKLPAKQLQVYKKLCEMLVKQFYSKLLHPIFVLVKELGPEKEFISAEEMWWKEKTNTEPFEFRDLVLVLFKRVFGDEVLTPLSFLNVADVLELEVSDSTFSTFADLLAFSPRTGGRGDENNNETGDGGTSGSSDSGSNAKFFSKTIESFIMTHIKSMQSPSTLEKLRDQETTFHLLKSSLARRHGAFVTEDSFFFHRVVLELPQPLKSFPKLSTPFLEKIRLNQQRSSLTKCNIDLYRAFKLHHPLIMCLLHHLRDRDNNMLDLSHPLVRQIMGNSLHKPSQNAAGGGGGPIISLETDDWLSIFMNTTLNDQWNSQDDLLSINRRPSHVTNENSNYSLDDGLLSNSDVMGSSCHSNGNLLDSIHSNGTKMIASIHSCLGLNTGSNVLVSKEESSNKRVGASEPLLLESKEKNDQNNHNKSYPV